MIIGKLRFGTPIEKGWDYKFKEGLFKGTVLEEAILNSDKTTEKVIVLDLRNGNQSFGILIQTVDTCIEGRPVLKEFDFNKVLMGMDENTVLLIDGGYGKTNFDALVNQIVQRATSPQDFKMFRFLTKERY